MKYCFSVVDMFKPNCQQLLPSGSCTVEPIFQSLYFSENFGQANATQNTNIPHWKESELFFYAHPQSKDLKKNIYQAVVWKRILMKVNFTRLL